MSVQGVGIVNLSNVRKTRHEASVVRNGTPTDPTRVPSIIAPSVAFIKPGRCVMGIKTQFPTFDSVVNQLLKLYFCSDIGVAELSLGVGKSPVCIVLSEDVQMATPASSRKIRFVRQ